jgi:hypothetical protein
MSVTDVKAAEEAIQFWNQGDRAGFLTAFHPEGQWSSAIKRQVEGGDGLYRGRVQIGEFWDEWHDVWSDLQIAVSEISSPRDGCVIAFGALEGTGIGSGVGVDQPFGWLLQIEGGLVREVTAYFSREEVLEAAGLSG